MTSSRLTFVFLLVSMSGSTGCFLFPTNPAAERPAAGVEFELAGQRFTVETVASDLEVPWSLGFSPDGTTRFVTERPGRLRALDPATGATLFVQNIPGVSPQVPRSEQGLMGLAVSPDFASDPILVVSYSVGGPVGTRNVIERYRVVGQGFELADEGPLLGDLPASFIHDGLGLEFGPDGKLYASTGDATQGARAQDLTYLGGKFLRMNPDGSIPDDNPFSDSLVFSFGHRNPQGFDFLPGDPSVIISTEHGPSAPLDGPSGFDEINRVVAGANYGWPLVIGDGVGEGLTPPLYHSGEEAIAPAGGTFSTSGVYPSWQDAFLFVGLRGASLWVLELSADGQAVVNLERGLQNTFGRLRAITQGPDGHLYLSTSNRDGRGTPAANDDLILRLVPVE